MQAIEAAAFVSIGRACGFAGLAILCVMLSLCFDPALAARAGGMMGLGLSIILVMFGLRARRCAYRHTETWLILAEDDRPPLTIAQRVIGETLRETYFRFAEKSAIGSLILLLLSLAMSLLVSGT